MKEAFVFVSELLAKMIFDVAQETEGREDFKDLIQSYLTHASGINLSTVVRNYNAVFSDEHLLRLAKAANDMLFAGLLLPRKMEFIFQHEPLTGTTRLLYRHSGTKETLVEFFHEKENLS